MPKKPTEKELYAQGYRDGYHGYTDATFASAEPFHYRDGWRAGMIERLLDSRKQNGGD